MKYLPTQIVRGIVEAGTEVDSPQPSDFGAEFPLPSCSSFDFSEDLVRIQVWSCLERAVSAQSDKT